MESQKKYSYIRFGLICFGILFAFVHKFIMDMSPAAIYILWGNGFFVVYFDIKSILAARKSKKQIDENK